MKSFGKFLIFVGVLLLIFICVTWVVRWYNVKKGCTSYLKLAGDAPTIEKAVNFLNHAIDYMEKNHLTKGNSAIFFPTPESDLEIWYNQIMSAKNTANRILQKGDPNTELEQIENDNALMKIREVVTDHSEDGTTVTTPPNISWFPHQILFVLGFVFSIIFIGAGFILSLSDY